MTLESAIRKLYKIHHWECRRRREWLAKNNMKTRFRNNFRSRDVCRAPDTNYNHFFIFMVYGVLWVLWRRQQHLYTGAVSSQVESQGNINFSIISMSRPYEICVTIQLIVWLLKHPSFHSSSGSGSFTTWKEHFLARIWVNDIRTSLLVIWGCVAFIRMPSGSNLSDYPVFFIFNGVQGRPILCSVHCTL